MKGFLQHHFSESVMTWTHVYKGVVETWSGIQTDIGSQYQVPVQWALPIYSRFPVSSTSISTLYGYNTWE